MGNNKITIQIIIDGKDFHDHEFLELLPSESKDRKKIDKILPQNEREQNKDKKPFIQCTVDPDQLKDLILSDSKPKQTGIISNKSIKTVTKKAGLPKHITLPILIRFLKKNSGLTNEEFAPQIGVKPATLKNWMSFQPQNLPNLLKNGKDIILRNALYDTFTCTNQEGQENTDINKEALREFFTYINPKINKTTYQDKYKIFKDITYSQIPLFIDFILRDLNAGFVKDKQK